MANKLKWSFNILHRRITCQGQLHYKYIEMAILTSFFVVEIIA